MSITNEERGKAMVRNLRRHEPTQAQLRAGATAQDDVHEVLKDLTQDTLQNAILAHIRGREGIDPQKLEAFAQKLSRHAWMVARD